MEDAYEIERKKQLESFLKKKSKQNRAELLDGQDAEKVTIELKKLALREK